MMNNKYKEEIQSLISTNEVEKLMLNVRGQNVLLDSDVAMLDKCEKHGNWSKKMTGLML